jgi:2-C-methyl-D-erythritol 4-phosphate cytidylyltransferase
MQDAFNLVIACAGSGNRFKSDIPKQFVKVNNKTILEHTLTQFESLSVGRCILAVAKEYVNQVNNYVSSFNFPITVVQGASTRSESVKNALKYCDSYKLTLIHDAVRPCVSKALIERVLSKLNTHKAVIPGVQPADTIKQVSGNIIKKTLDRNSLIRVQTPQGFHTALLQDVYKQPNVSEFTDDASLIEASGYEIASVLGDEVNFKITVPEDLNYFQYYLDVVQKSN